MTPNPVLPPSAKRRRRRRRTPRGDAGLPNQTMIDDERGAAPGSNNHRSIMLRQVAKGVAAAFLAGGVGTGVTAFSAVCGAPPRQRPHHQLISIKPHQQPAPPPIMVPSPPLLGVSLAPPDGTRQFLEGIISGQEAAAAAAAAAAGAGAAAGATEKELHQGHHECVSHISSNAHTNWGGAGRGGAAAAIRLKEEPTDFGAAVASGSRRPAPPSRDRRTTRRRAEGEEESQEEEEDTDPHRVLPRRRQAAVPPKKPKPKHGYRRSPNRRTQAIHDRCAELCQSKLLTRAEEYELGTKIQVLMRRTEARQQVVGRLDRPASWAEWAEECGTTIVELKESVRIGEDSKRTMVEANMRMVISIARKYQHCGVPLADLIQEGSLGLVRAVEKFDPERGFKLSTYSAWWIQQAVFKGIAHQSRTIRLPVHVHNLLNSVRRARRELATSKGQQPSDHEIAGHLDMPVKRLQRYLELTKESVSYEMPTCDGSSTLEDTLVATDRGHPEREGDALLFRTKLRELVEELSEDERIILSLRFGLTDGKRKSLRQIAEIVRTPQSYVRRIESTAMRKLRSPEQMRRLRGFIFDSACSSSSTTSSRISFDGLLTMITNPNR
ncbi:unnamed protein product [Pylaiella littoralis]